MQHIVVLSIDSGDPSVTDFHHGLLKAHRSKVVIRFLQHLCVHTGSQSFGALAERKPQSEQWFENPRNGFVEAFVYRSVAPLVKLDLLRVRQIGLEHLTHFIPEGMA
jgi:hypothetical protein